MRALASLGVACALASGIAAAVSTRTAAAASHAAATGRGGALVAQIDRYRKVTWRWQRVIGAPRTQSSGSARRSPDPAYRRWVLRLWKHRARRVQREAARWLLRETRRYQATVAHWRHVMGISRVPARSLASAGMLEQRLRQWQLWRQRARLLVRRAHDPPLRGAWMCIHRYEGSWGDGAAPYYGGLQMDIRFQRSYGPYLLRTKGTANRWTPLEQMWVATKAYRAGLGFSPWPNTARACGLI